jgi:hypothetical protein
MQISDNGIPPELLYSLDNLNDYTQSLMKKSALIKELDKGEKSGIAENFNKDTFLKNMKAKYLKKSIGQEKLIQL